MYTLRRTGFFVLGGTLLLAIYLLFFANRYSFSQVKLPLEQEKALFSANSTLFEQTFSDHITLLSHINDAFARYDQVLQETYALDEKAQAAWAESLPDSATPFAWEQLKYVAPYAPEEVEHFHRQALAQYGSWLVGRTYENRAAFAQDLTLVAANVSKYATGSVNLFPIWDRDALKSTWIRRAAQGSVAKDPGSTSILLFGMLILGALLCLLPRYSLDGTPGIKNNGVYHNSMSSRGWIGWGIGMLLIAFYITLYFYPSYLTPWVMLLDPLSMWLKNSAAGPFFLYGFLYTVTILLMGLRMFIKYRHSTYHKVRTASLMFFQTALAFLLPEILLRLNRPYFDFKNIWPLDYDFFFDSELTKLVEGGGLGLFMLGWGIALTLVAVPVFTYFFGKRWYCSWVCGCGGLAETLGDPYRQLSDKSTRAWKIERASIYSILLLAIGMTATVLYTYWSGESEILGVNSYSLRQGYGFYVGALFSGVVGTGFYPLMGSRVWCRFGCPLAAYLGLIQRLRSRFRITTNGGQCISCGNCSTYCEMGIDVRAYAQKGAPIVRASCVGCGVCASVCPRGVLRLENDGNDRFSAKLPGLSQLNRAETS